MEKEVPAAVVDPSTAPIKSSNRKEDLVEPEASVATSAVQVKQSAEAPKKAGLLVCIWLQVPASF